ncbi:Ovarian tumor [Macleaya cordata]|uniref:Ovarian tumor n=1 Tax=Macleaya cordata TaxID=56857 RepID=A0A200Q520_MACCD|nr:Ovarian tumor [Macleaya cordata]
MHNMIKNEIVEVKASFEHSLTSVKHSHRRKELKEIWNHVSHKALNKICKELNRLEDEDIAEISCRCVLRTSHGLPCAHELEQYARKCMPIPLLDIDPQWKKLSINHMQHQEFNFDELPFIQKLKKRWFEASDPERSSLQKKLEELATPKTTNLQEPSNQVKGKGRPFKRPKMNKNDSTEPRVQSPQNGTTWFQKKKKKKKNGTSSQASHVHGTSKPQVVSKGCGTNEPQMSKACESNSTKEQKQQRGSGWKHLKCIPEIMQAYVSSIEDVEGDGNCGYRVFAYQLGFDRSDGWRKVREDILNELNSNHDLYARMFTEEGFNKIKSATDCFEPPYKWMTMPDAGYVVASTYNVVVIFLTDFGSTTLLPLCNPPIYGQAHRVVTIAFVNGNHFVGVKLSDGSPIPTLGVQWYPNCTNAARSWLNPYLPRIGQYRKLMFPKKNEVPPEVVDISQ